MKLIVLITGGRAGSKFFQSLLDGHSQVMQFPGPFFFDIFLKKIKNKKDSNMIAETFVQLNPFFFNSINNYIDRHNMLGENKNEHFKVDKNSFVKNFVKIFDNSNSDKKSLLYSLHAAYFAACNKDITGKKVMILHIHSIKRLKTLSLLDFDIIYFLRDPLANLNSAVKNWSSYKDGEKFSPANLWYHIDRVINGIHNTLKFNKKTFVIQIEKLHINFDSVIKEFCNLYDLKKEDCLNHSTYHGKKWWGDAVSKKFIYGINKNFKNNFNENDYFKKDIYLLEKYLKSQIEFYKYPLRSKFREKFMTKLLPLKFELFVWKKSIIKFKLINILSIPKYWLYRILSMRKNLISKFPHSIG